MATPRFEIVSAPLEERVHTTLREQTEIAVQTILALVRFVNEKRDSTLNSTSSLLRNEEFVRRATSTSATLLQPTSLPGFLLLLAVLIRIVHYVALSMACNKALRLAHTRVLNGEKRD